MARIVMIPATQRFEEIQSIVEYQQTPNSQGCVRVTIGVLNEEGVFLTPQNFESYEIYGDDYNELIGPPTAWALDKPIGTYRNEDLWHFVDKYRNL